MEIQITIKDLREIWALRHACETDVTRPALRNIAYIHSVNRFFATNGHIVRSIRVDHWDTKPPSDFVVTQPALKVSLTIADATAMAVGAAKVRLECLEDETFPNILAAIGNIPKSAEEFTPLGMIGVDPKVLQQFVKSYVKAPQCLVFGFTGDLKIIHVFLPTGEWQGGILPVRIPLPFKMKTYKPQRISR